MRWSGLVLKAYASRAKGDDARRDVAEVGDAEEYSYEPRDANHLRRLESASDDALLNLRLDELHDARGPFAFALDGFQIVDRHPTGEERLGEKIRGNDGVLDGVVDADAADRRHHVRSVADQEDSPGAYQRGQRFDSTESSAICCQSVSERTCFASAGRISTM